MHVVISYCEDDAIKERYLPLADNITKDYDRQSYGLMLNYLEATQKHILAHLQTAVYNQEDETLYMAWALPKKSMWTT